MTEARHLSDQQIQTILNGSEDLSETNPSLAKHLDHCTHCQQKIQAMTADDWWWHDGRSLLVGAATNSQFEVSQSGQGHLLESHYFELYDPAGYLVSKLEPANQTDLLGQLDEYIVEKVVGIGGMGIVFKGHDTELNRAVAIKFLAPHLVQQEIARHRFFREAKASAAVCHENVVPIYRIGSHRGFPFFVMPYVSNESLQSLIDQNGPIDLTSLVQIGVQMAAGIAAAHEQGLVHRDIKPGNVLLQDGINRLLISDFGLVFDYSSTPLTQTGLIAGTPGYMSPEQAAGKPVEYGSDLFSLGSVLYFAATGKLPFDGENAMLVLDKVRHQPSSIQSVRPDLPPTFAAIVDRLMAKTTTERFSSAQEVKEVFLKYLAHLQDPKQNRLPLVGSRPRNLQSLFWLGSIAILSLALIGIWYPKLWQTIWRGASPQGEVENNPSPASRHQGTRSNTQAVSAPQTGFVETVEPNSIIDLKSQEGTSTFDSRLFSHPTSESKSRSPDLSPAIDTTKAPLDTVPNSTSLPDSSH